MSHFLDSLSVTPLPDGLLWRLNANFRYQSDVYGALLTVPTGFKTDFASTPSILWSKLPPWGVYGPATIIHDWLYATQPCTRKQADDVLLEAMTVLDVDPVVRQFIYDGVRLGGQAAWDRDAALKVTGAAHLSAR